MSSLGAPSSISPHHSSSRENRRSAPKRKRDEAFTEEERDLVEGALYEVRRDKAPSSYQRDWQERSPCHPTTKHAIHGPRGTWILNTGQQLGKGAWGTVYQVCKGHDKKDCKYAIKVGNVNRSEVELHKRAAKYDLAKPIVDFWKCKYRYLGAVYVTEFLTETLDNRMRRMDRAYMKESEILGWFKGIADMILDLHQKARIAHTDIKRKNMMLDEKGRLFFVDFGLAVELLPGQWEIPPPKTGILSNESVMLTMLRLQQDWDGCKDCMSLIGFGNYEWITKLPDVILDVAILREFSLQQAEALVINEVLIADADDIVRLGKTLDDTPAARAPYKSRADYERAFHGKVKDEVDSETESVATSPASSNYAPTSAYRVVNKVLDLKNALPSVPAREGDTSFDQSRHDTTGETSRLFSEDEDEHHGSSPGRLAPLVGSGPSPILETAHWKRGADSNLAFDTKNSPSPMSSSSWYGEYDRPKRETPEE